ncbi:MAG: monovalent cation/H+ antiporter subunit D family protein [Puniceicoccaceae bacterium]
MDTYVSTTPLFAMLVSLVVVPLILMSGRHPNLREFWTILAAILKFALVCSLLPGALQGQSAAITLLEIAPGIALELKADPFGVFFALIASGLWIPTSFYSIGYMRGNGEGQQTRYFASFAVCLSATIGIAFSANLLTFIIFYEILTLATYPLVIHKENKEAIAAGRKYLAYTLTAGLLLIIGAGVVYHLTGTLNFEAGGILEHGMLNPHAALTLFIVFVAGVGVKAGIMPLHSWLPAAMAAPTPVSALLHAVAVVKSGVFALARVTGFIFGPETLHHFALNDLLVWIALTTILLASLLAFRQDNLKKRLAYSTVGHLSYIVLGVALLTPSGWTGGLFHIATHATMKITLFFCAGAIYVNLHRTHISQLDGIGKVMPWTMGAFTVGSLGLCGVPLVNGFLSKWFLGVGTLEAGLPFALLVLVLSGLLNAGYFFPILYRAFFKEGSGLEQYTEARPAMVIPLVSTAVLSLVFGLFPNLVFQFFELATQVTLSVIGGS